MGNGTDQRRRHFILEGGTQAATYPRVHGVLPPDSSPRDCAKQSGALRERLDELRTGAGGACHPRRTLGPRSTECDRHCYEFLGRSIEWRK